jgi:hypothetical protein
MNEELKWFLILLALLWLGWFGVLYFFYLDFFF